MKTWEDAIHYPEKLCGRCGKITRCLHVSNVLAPEVTAAIFANYFCKECFEVPLMTLFSCSSTEEYDQEQV